MQRELSKIILKKKIAHGAFGEIYVGLDLDSNKEVAVKIEKPGYNQLRYEYSIYQRISGSNTPDVYDYGKIIHEGIYHNCMTMDLLGLSLEKMFNHQNRKFSIKTILLIAKSCLERIEMLHLKHHVHRDIKPDNFVLSKNNQKIYLIDYGLAKEYRSPSTLVHRAIKTGKNLTGTARYASLNTHLGIEQSRRDDLEGLGFMLIYFFKGKLPWQGLKAKDKAEKYEKIKQYKQEISLEALCEGLPKQIFSYMSHVRSLEYDEYPNYIKLLSFFC